MADEETSIRVKVSTKKMLDGVGNKGDTYDDIIRRLAQAAMKVQAKQGLCWFWQEKNHNTEDLKIWG